MKSPNKATPIELSPVRDLSRNAYIYSNKKTKKGEIYIEKENGDSTVVTPLTKDDAIAIIAGLREAFDIPDRSAELALLLDMRDERHESFVEQFATTCIANLMYENGLKTAVITTDRILREDAPQVSINANKVGLIEYTLIEEPLNVKDATDN